MHSSWILSLDNEVKGSSQVILNPRGMDKKRVDVAVRDQKSVSGRVWARIVHSRPSRETPALDADAEAAARLV